MKKAAIFVALLAGFLLVAELTLRAAGFGEPPLAQTDPQIEYYPRPDASYRRFGNLIAINRHGMRSEDWGAGPPQRERHVALLGDSVVYGTHALDQSQTLAARLKSLLEEQRGTSVIVSAIAASSWGPANMLAFYNEKGPFPGQSAVVVLSSHDLGDYPTFRSDEIPYRLRAPSGALHDFLISAVGRIGVGGAADLNAATPVERQRLTVQALEQLLTVLKHDFDRVLVVFHPAIDELAGNAITEEEQLQGVATQAQVEFLSLRPIYAGARAAGAAVYSDGLHLDAGGTSLLARVLAGQLARPE